MHVGSAFPRPVGSHRRHSGRVAGFVSRRRGAPRQAPHDDETVPGSPSRAVVPAPSAMCPPLSDRAEHVAAARPGTRSSIACPAAVPALTPSTSGSSTRPLLAGCASVEDDNPAHRARRVRLALHIECRTRRAWTPETRCQSRYGRSRWRHRRWAKAPHLRRHPVRQSRKLREHPAPKTRRMRFAPGMAHGSCPHWRALHNPDRPLRRRPERFGGCRRSSTPRLGIEIPRHAWDDDREVL